MTFKTRWQNAYNQQSPPESLDGGILQFNGYRNPRLYNLLQNSLRRATANWQHWHILDAGCGTGDTNGFLNQNNQVIGSDFSWQMARYAQNTYSQVSLADVEQMPFRSASFDGVIATGVWQCLPPNTPFLSEVARILKPSGEAVFGWVLNADFLLYRKGVHFRLDPTVSISLLSLSQISSLLQTAGLEPIQLYAAVFPLGVFNLAHSFTRPIVPAYTVKCRKIDT